jgi:predicted lipoprotein with Yx(FWY)xxD motif
MRAMMLVGLVAAVVILGAGCGDSGSDDGQASAAATTQPEEAMKSGSAMEAEAMASGSKGRLIKAVGSDYGRVIADAKGEAFYLFDKEDGPKSECYGACAAAWPPVLTSGKPRAGNGLKASLLGTTRRKNGKLQVTYAGHPLYYYVDDSPGTILCQNVDEFGGLWLVVKPNGAPVT